jgi:hypothetical protein
LNVYYYLAFAYNATGDFATAKRLLQSLGFPAVAGSDFSTASDDQALTTYVDTLRELGEDAEAQGVTKRFLAWDVATSRPIFAKSWWVATNRACKLLVLGDTAGALATLEGMNAGRGLAQTPLLMDRPCFKHIAGEPRYVAVIEHQNERQRILRERLPATLRRQGVADAGASPR